MKIDKNLEGAEVRPAPCKRRKACVDLLRGRNFRELKHARFWDADGNRKWPVFPFSLSSLNHIYIAKYLFSIRDD